MLSLVVLPSQTLAKTSHLYCYLYSYHVLEYAEAEDGLVYSVGGRGRTFPSHINAAMKR